MVGEGPLESELKELVNRHQLDRIIEFIPLVAQQKLGELYRQADAVILSSEGEGFGLVLVEAGLTGRPVVGARSGGITDIIQDGDNGLLFETGDIEALAESMKTVITDPELRNRMGERGYQNAVEKFSTPILVDRVYNLFQSVMMDRRENTIA
jgi:glycosyltransferase involved in cell wall biosynthesis